MNDVPQVAPQLRWAVHTAPDFLVLRLPAVPAAAAGGAHDAMKALFAKRGFRPVTETDALDLGVANGCALTRLGPASAELVVTIGARVGASRIPLDGIDPAWLERAVDAGQAAVLLVVESAVREDGTTTKDDLRRDVDAGGVLASLVPSGDVA